MNILKKGDIFLVIIVIAAALTALAFYNWSRDKHKEGSAAIVKQGDVIVHRINLDEIKEPYTFEIEGDYRLVVEVSNGSIRVLEADCPDRLCVKSGWLRYKGDIAVCLPNKTMIKLEGVNDSVDGISY